jgi:glycosyltransferase involved in cell wall biosynthesis
MTSSTGMVVRTKAEAKRLFNYDPDRFLVLRVDRNTARKNYSDTWRALQPVMERHPDIDVHFHCQAKEEVDLGYLLTRNPETKERFFFPAGVTGFKGWPEQDLAILYNAADAFVSTAWGEGFGLTLLEAAACGTPIVASAVASVPEVVGDGGLLVEPERDIAVFAGSDMKLPDVRQFSNFLEQLYEFPQLRDDLGKQGASHAKSFSWDVAAERFNALIGDAASRPSKEVTDADLGGEVQDLLGAPEGIPE